MLRRHYLFLLSTTTSFAILPIHNNTAKANEAHLSSFSEATKISQPHERAVHLVLSLPGNKIAEMQARHMRLISSPDRPPQQRGLVLAAGQALGRTGAEGILSSLVPTERLDGLLAEIRRDGTIIAETSKLGDLAARETFLANRLMTAQALRARLSDLQAQAPDPLMAYQALAKAQEEVNQINEELEAIRFGRQRTALVVSYVASDASTPPTPAEELERQIRLAGYLGMAVTPLAVLLGAMFLRGLARRRTKTTEQ